MNEQANNKKNCRKKNEEHSCNLNSLVRLVWISLEERSIKMRALLSARLSMSSKYLICKGRNPSVDNRGYLVFCLCLLVILIISWNQMSLKQQFDYASIKYFVRFALVSLKVFITILCTLRQCAILFVYTFVAKIVSAHLLLYVVWLLLFLSFFFCCCHVISVKFHLEFRQCNRALFALLYSATHAYSCMHKIHIPSQPVVNQT